MGTFVPIDLTGGASAGRTLATGRRFVPMDDYGRERDKLAKSRALLAKHEYFQGDDIVSRGLRKVGKINDALTGQPVLPVLDEIAGGLAAGGNELVNRVWRQPRGEKPVSSEAIYRANVDDFREEAEKKRRAAPVSSAIGGFLSGLPAAPEALGAKALAAAPGAAEAAPGLLAKAAGYGRNVAKGAGIGAAYGGAYGAADAEEGERLEGAGQGALLGGLTGGALETVAPVVTKGAKLGYGAAKDLLRAAKKPTAEAEREAGTATARAILERKGLTADEAASRAAAYGDGLDPMAAELAGKDVEGLLAATARRPGATGDLAMARKLERQEGAPERVLKYARDDLGVNPATAQGDMDETVRLGRALADPEYAAMRANKSGIWNDQLQEISQRPNVRKAMASVEAMRASEGRAGQGLAYGTVDVPSSPVGPDDLSFAATGAPDSMPVPRGPAEAPTRGPSALTALRQTGKGMSADLDQQGLRLGQRGGGAELNDMAIRLHEMGFTPRVLDESEMASLLEGPQARSLFAQEADAGAQQRFEARRAAEEFNARGGDPSALPHPDDYGDAGMAPERPLTEPARQQAPTQESWDDILAAMDDLVERDQLSGKEVRTGPTGRANRAVGVETRDLRNALIGDEGAAPELKAARAVSSDYMGLSGAYERAKGRLTKGTFGDLKKVFDSAKSPAEQDAMRGAIANDIYEMWQQGQVKAGRVKTPRVQGKLELMFGKKGAKAFVSRIEQEAQLAASASRIAPTGGSPTFGLLEGGAEADRAAITAGRWKRAGGKLLSKNPLGALGEVASLPFDYAKSAGLSQGARDRLGEILMMGPDELVPLLREWEKQPEPVQRALIERAAALGLVSGRNVARTAAPRGLRDDEEE
jgi:hypothetical protein